MKDAKMLNNLNSEKVEFIEIIVHKESKIGPEGCKHMKESFK